MELKELRFKVANAGKQVYKNTSNLWVMSTPKQIIQLPMWVQTERDALEYTVERYVDPFDSDPRLDGLL
jgi:hypothetical protein